MDELLKGVKIGKAIGRQEKKSDIVKMVMVAVGVVTTLLAIAAVIYTLYQRWEDNNCYEDFEDDFDDLFDEDGEDDIFEE